VWPRSRPPASPPVTSDVAAQVAAAQRLASVSFTAAQATAGEAGYTSNCASCHGDDLDDGEFGPPLKGVPAAGEWLTWRRGSDGLARRSASSRRRATWT
jgi:mono/diheme cytochrome c family protein